jgi:peptidoglycan/LPS O-acetylase OafA/YrhL
MLLIYGEIDNHTVLGRMLALATFMDNFAIWIKGYDNSIPFSAHLWTLSYEFQIYLIIPLAFLTYSGIGKQKFTWVLGLFGLLCLVARLAFVFLAAPHPLIWVTPFLRPDSTLLGIAIGLGLFNGLAKLFAAFMLLGSGAMIVLMPNVDVIGWSTVLLYPTMAIFCGSLAWLAINADYFRLLLSCPPIVFLGKISFGLYVFHFLAIHLVSVASPSWGLEVQFAAALLLTGAFATASYYILERPFLALKRRVSVVESKAI